MEVYLAKFLYIVMHKIDINTFDSSISKEGIIEKCSDEWWLKVEFYYQSVFKNAKILRDFIRIICTYFSVPAKDISRMILVVDELNNNAIEYGSMEKENNIMRVCIEKNKHGRLDFKLEVQDTGNGLKHKTADEMRKIQEVKLGNGFEKHSSIRWRGLFLITLKIVDELYFENSLTGWLIVGIDTSFQI